MPVAPWPWALGDARVVGRRVLAEDGRAVCGARGERDGTVGAGGVRAEAATGAKGTEECKFYPDGGGPELR